jgi:hypothetical protein
MKDGPRRLLDYGDDLNGLLRGALDAERSDDVDAARLERIGRRVAAAAAGAATAPAQAIPAEVPDASAIETAAKTGWLGWKGPVVLVAVAAIGGAAAIGLRADRPKPVPAPTSAPATMTPVESTPPAPEEPATVSPADLPNAPVVASTPKVAVKAAAASEVDEIALLARAHDALRGEPARSLALCKEHERRFATGQFAQEREAVAIEALVYLGRRDEAERRWSAFRERYPSSSHRVHLESLLAAPPAQ